MTAPTIRRGRDEGLPTVPPGSEPGLRCYVNHRGECYAAATGRGPWRKKAIPVLVFRPDHSVDLEESKRQTELAQREHDAWLARIQPEDTEREALARACRGQT